MNKKVPNWAIRIARKIGKQLREGVIALLVYGELLIDASEQALDSEAFAAYVLVMGMGVGGFLVGYALST